MARGTTLAVVRDMVKAECGESLATNADVDTELYNLISNTQQWLVTEWDWPFLKHRWDATCPASTQFVTWPTAGADTGDTSYVLDQDRIERVMVLDSNIWRPVDYGIEENELSLYDFKNDSTAVADPIRRWQMHDAAKFEVWPVPATAQTLRFVGPRVLTSLKTNGAFDSTKTLDLDDLLVVYYCAAERLARRKQADAAAKLERARERMRVLRAMYPTETRRVVLGESNALDLPPVRTVPVVGIA